MSFFQLVRRETKGSLGRLAFMSALGGVSTAAVLASVNAGAQAAEAGQVDLWSASLFVVAVLLFIKTQHYLLVVTTAESESIVHRIRVRILDQVRQSELASFDEIGRAEIISAITEDTATLTQAANSLAFMVQGIVLIIFVALYVIFLSLIAFALCVVIIGVAGVVYHARTRDRLEGMREAATWERRFVARMDDVLDGFKELRLNAARSDQLMDHLREVSRRAANIKIFAQSESLKQLVFSQSAMYVLLGAIVFVVPTFSDAMPPGSITKNTMAVLFVVGACYGVMQTATMMSAADVAADHLEQLEERLRAAATAPSPDPVEPTPRGFETIEMRQVVFRYADKPSDPGFQIGPLDFTLRAGELIFVTGGNGSGKSTFLKVLAGLYPPASGQIALDGAPVDVLSIHVYRSLIAAVFTDSHLFDHLFGIAPSESEVDALLRKFDLDHKTSVVEGEFTTLDLSGGQSKRLSLVVGLLEKRPILLLDEWTANQDPHFRRRFYDEILPELNNAGLAIVVITHDDFYLDQLRLPARRLRMDKGRFV